MNRILLAILVSILLSGAGAETLTVEFTPSKASETVEGNLLVIVSSQKFDGEGPGLLDVYQHADIHCREGVKLKAGDRIEVEVPDHAQAAYAGAYLDEDRDFMGTALADPGEYFTGKVVALDGRDAALRLDTRKAARPRKVPAWMQEHVLVSERMQKAGFTPEQSTVRFLVGLPPGYWQRQQRYPVLFVSHGFSGNRWTYLGRYKIWRDEMKKTPMILVSLDSNGPHGHHVFLNSEGNGPRQDVLTEEIVPFIDSHFRSDGRRAVYGQSSGGWTAISLLRRAPTVFRGAAATGPDPLTLRPWWMGPNENLFRNPDGSERTFSPVIKISMRRFVDCEIESQSFGQFSAFLAAFSPYRPEAGVLPFLSPFDLSTGALRPEVWKIWEDNDQSLWVQAHPDQAREIFSNRLAMFVGDADEFGLYDTTMFFSHTLDELGIPHAMTVIPGAGHTSYLDDPAFQRKLWATCYGLATR